jgi:tight adherence protein B
MTFSSPDVPVLAGLLAVILTIVLGVGVSDGFTPGPRRGGVVDGVKPARGRSAARRVAARWRRWRIGNDIEPEVVAAWCDGLTRSLRAGNTLRQSLLHQVPAHALLRTATRPLRQSLEHGRPVSSAIDELIDRSGSSGNGIGPHLRLVGSVLAGTADVGGSAAAPLDRVAGALRLRVVDGQERAAHSAQARLSAHVLTLVPLGVLVLLVATDAHVRGVVVQPVGAVVLVAGLTLNLGGWWWMRSIVRSPT